MCSTWGAIFFQIKYLRVSVSYFKLYLTPEFKVGSFIPPICSNISILLHVRLRRNDGAHHQGNQIVGIPSSREQRVFTSPHNHIEIAFLHILSSSIKLGVAFSATYATWEIEGTLPVPSCGLTSGRGGILSMLLWIHLLPPPRKCGQQKLKLRNSALHRSKAE